MSTNTNPQLITTSLAWQDLVIDPAILQQLQEILGWLKYGNALLKETGLNKPVKPGYRALFYGPPGTGKTLSASLIGKITGNDVYRVNLAELVSKFIGETEKNLTDIFNNAQQYRHILFFDEAEALFGHPTSDSAANDRYASTTIAHLRQCITQFPGLVILSAQLKENIDQAIASNFESNIYFPMPTVSQRLQLWKNAFSGQCILAPQIDLNEIAQTYQLSGGSIINVLRYCALAVSKRNDTTVTEEELLIGIERDEEVGNKEQGTRNNE